MTLSFLPKKLAFLSLSFTVSTSIVNASDIEELASKKLIIAFDVSPEKKTPSLRNVSDFCTWQEVFEKASSEIAKKCNYLKCLRGVEINGIFDGIESNRTFLKKTADYQAQTKFKELDIWTEPLADKAFIDTAKAIKSLIEFHEKTPEYLSQKYQSLIQSCTNFTKYEEISAIKKLNKIIQKIPSLMTEPFLYQNSVSLMELAKHMSEAQQLVTELSASKLKKRKGSNPASASSSPKGSPKSEEIKKPKLKEKPRSRSFSGKPSNSKIDPIYKQFAEEALSKKQPNPEVPEGK